MDNIAQPELMYYLVLAILIIVFIHSMYQENRRMRIEAIRLKNEMQNDLNEERESLNNLRKQCYRLKSANRWLLRTLLDELEDRG